MAIASSQQGLRERCGVSGDHGSHWILLAFWALASGLGPVPAHAQEQELTKACTVSVLNRTAPVDERGAWLVPNVPIDAGPVRVRATCVEEGGTTRSGQSGWVTIPANGSVRVSDISFTVVEPIPATLALSAPTTVLNGVGETVQLTATATYPDGLVEEVNGAAAGTSYVSSNPGVATVDADGLVTAQASGAVLVSATNEGALALLRLTVAAADDSDGDGMPDDWEIANGLDPNNPADAMDDPDEDGLSNLEEFQLGTDPLAGDTDGDDLLDGEEVNQVGTNPLLFDTDGDQVSDGLELIAGSDPLSGASVSLQGILAGVEIDPPSLTLIFNSVVSEASHQLVVFGDLIDGTRIDITLPLYSTSYSSSDLSVVSFGVEPGRVFAGQEGTATVTATAAGVSGTTHVTVEAFTPRALSFLPLAGSPRAVVVAGEFAYVAAGVAGLAVVDVSNPAAPVLVTTQDTPGYAWDVAVEGDVLYLADGDQGVLLLDIVDPSNPISLATVALDGVARGLALRGGVLYVANESGLRILDVAVPTAPVVLGGLDLGGVSRAVDVREDYAVVANQSSRVTVVDISDPVEPGVVGSVHTRPSSSRAADVQVRGSLAYVADGSSGLGGLKAIDFSRPETPYVLGSTSNDLGLKAIALDGEWVVAADIRFVNAVPIFHADPRTLQLRGLLDFSGAPSFRDDNGTDVATRDGFVYLTASRWPGSTNANGGLHIGQFLIPEDDGTTPPQATIVAPEDGSSVYERHLMRVQAEASDDVRVVGVRFLLDGEELFTDYLAPYEVEFRAPVGVEQILVEAIAIDPAHLEGEPDQVQLDVLPDTEPVVGILAPQDGDSVLEGGVLPIVLEAYDDEGLISVDLYVNDALEHSFAAPPYTISYEVPFGETTLQLRAEATDSGKQTETSETVTVQVTPNLPPQVVILEPSEGAELEIGSTIEVLVGVADEVGAESVRLTANGAPQGELTDEPYLFQVVVLPASQLRLVAEATDPSEQVGTSEELVLTVRADPGTTAIGIVVDPDEVPVADAAVTCRGVAGTTSADGSFAIAGVPAMLGEISCTARRYDPEVGVVGIGRSSRVSPIPDGVTDVGEIQLAPLSGDLYPVPKVFLAAEQVGQLTEYGLFALGDLDHDGNLDLVAPEQDATFSPRSFYWLGVAAGRGDGTFEEVERHDILPFKPEDFLLADVDGDGHLDAVAVGSELVVSLGNGDGTFQSPITSSLSQPGLTMTAADVDGDGVVDLAVRWIPPQSLDGGILVLRGSGDGTFTQVGGVDTGHLATDIELFDMDLDGHQDLLISFSSISDAFVVKIYWGDGTGAFGSSLALELPDPYSWLDSGLAAGDLDADGLPDIAFTTGAEHLVLWHGAGGRGFDAPIIQRTTSVGVWVQPRIGDLEGDGFLDVAMVSYYDSHVIVFNNDGTGIFDTWSLVPTDSGAVGLQLADLNGDGYLDLTTRSLESADVTTLLANGEGGFRTYHLHSFDPYLEPGLSDEEAGGLGDSGSLRSRPSFAPETLGGSELGYVAVGDLNGDGVEDVVAAGYLPTAVVLLGQGDGTFVEAFEFGNNFVRGFASGDFDEDGLLDLIVVTVISFGRTTTSLWPGRGDGTFEPPVEISTNECVRGLLVEDLDGNDALDFVATDACSDDVRIYLGVGDGTFSLTSSHAVGEEPRPVVSGDLNGDGNLDLVVGNYRSNDLSALFGLGGGQFSGETRLPLTDEPARNPLSLSLGDLDGDGALDIVYGRDFQDVGVLFGDAGGGFTVSETLWKEEGTYFGPISTHAVDVNEDGADDVVVASAYSGLYVLLSTGDRGFTQPLTYAAPSTGGSAIADMNGDGLPDVVTVVGASYLQNRVSVHLHQ